MGDGRLSEARALVVRASRPDVVAARRMSPGARAALSDAGIGWVDESGAAEIAVGTIIVSRSGASDPAGSRPTGWTPSALATAEALLCGTQPTTSAVVDATGLSFGACVKALRLLTDLGLLVADAARGRRSGRRLEDPDRLLREYSDAARRLASPLRVQVAVTWRDVIDGTAEFAARLTEHGVAYAVTGVVASALLAPVLTNVSTSEVYVAGTTIVDLESIARTSGLRPINGGRLTLRPFPTVTAYRLAAITEDMRVAPWPRVYTDLLGAGVRGEDAAEHLKEIIRGRRTSPLTSSTPSY
jgi:Transcriptional regulator, AbiEi antitoxin, Type IV TA system